jgi:hypothetical protein
MVPLSERRHRLYSNELPQVIEGLRLRLEYLLETQEDQESAKIAFRTLYRLLDTGVGRPKYPEFNWQNLRLYLDIYVPEIK